jgi:hypothetical protein
MLAAVRAEVTLRLGEVFQLLEHIRQLEATPPTPDPAEARILRGLFFVHLYAALEFTVNQGTQHFLQAVDALNVPPAHLEPSFFSVALDSSFSAFRNVGEDKRWAARLKLINQQSSAAAQTISGDLFGLYLQNIWIEKLDVLFRCFNIDQPVVPDPSYRLYVDELVDRRNGVAHGRFSALGIGGTRRSPELLIRYNAIAATCSHILDCLDQQHTSRGVVATAHRSSY